MFSRALCSEVRGATLIACCLLLTSASFAQVVINEVLADNRDTMPADIGGGTPDLVELFNTSEDTIVLGAEAAADSYYLTDNCVWDGVDGVEVCDFDSVRSWRFPPGVEIGGEEHLVIFCDDDQVAGLCELHARFSIDSNGNEALALWGPEVGGVRTRIDRVWLPPLGRDVAFGRVPDGTGGTNLGVEETLAAFEYLAPGFTTFGVCEPTVPEEDCGGGKKRRECLGAPNRGESNLTPRISLVEFSTHDPAADEPVLLTARLRDDGDLTPSNLIRVEIQYEIDGERQAPVAMVYREDLGEQNQADRGQPLDRFTLWEGAIPGQAAGAAVEFTLFVADVATASSSDPDDLCAAGVGPCNRIGTPGPNCVRDKDNDLRFESCDVSFRYRVAHAPEGALATLVINEVVAFQASIVEDVTDGTCGDANPNCQYDDYIEIYNGSDEVVDLSGLWLSDSALEPQRWAFPEGSTIAAREYLLVWVDGDGGGCPRPDSVEDGDGQTCPTPTDPEAGEYHTDFRLVSTGEEIYLFDREEAAFGLIHGVAFGERPVDVALVLCPDGDPNGTFRDAVAGVSGKAASPREANSCRSAIFTRGDADGNCTFNISDAVFTLNALFAGGSQPPCADAADMDDNGSVNVSDAVYGLNHLFAGGPATPPPGPGCPGEDPTEDALADCASTCAACEA